MNNSTKQFKGYIFLRLALMMFFAFSLSGFVLPDALVIERVAAAEDIKLNKSKLTIEVGRTYTLKVNGTKEKVTWSSSNTKIAKVDKSGKVTGVKKGSATITATVGGKKYTCKVTVKKKEYKVASSGLTVVKTHQEIMNDLNMTVIKTINKVTGITGYYSSDSDYISFSTPQYGDISNVVEIKLGYFTDKNKIKHYVVAVTNLTDKVFEDGASLSYTSQDGEYEYQLQLKKIQPGETRFYKFGTSSNGYTYVDYNYFKNLTFFYNEPFEDSYYKEIFKDSRKDFKVYSKEEKYTWYDGSTSKYIYMVIEGKQAIKDKYKLSVVLFLLDKNGKLIDVVEYDNESWFDTEKEIIKYCINDYNDAAKAIVAVNYIVESEYVQNEFTFDEWD